MALHYCSTATAVCHNSGGSERRPDPGKPLMEPEGLMGIKLTAAGKIFQLHFGVFSVQFELISQE